MALSRPPRIQLANAIVSPSGEYVAWKSVMSGLWSKWVIALSPVPSELTRKMAQCTVVQRVKRMLVPCGEKLGSVSAKEGSLSTWCKLPPRASISQICTEPSLAEVKANRSLSPSDDQLGICAL